MEHLEFLIDQMEEELDGAEHYAKLAHKHHEQHPAFAKNLHDMAMDELRHSQYISDAAHEYIKAHPEHPEFRNVWDFVKRHTAKQIGCINDMLTKFRNM